VAKLNIWQRRLTVVIECSIIFGSPLRTQRSAKVATEVSFFVEVKAAGQKVTCKPLDEVTERPHNSASLLFANTTLQEQWLRFKTSLN
jgi:hypothetical protein